MQPRYLKVFEVRVGEGTKGNRRHLKYRFYKFVIYKFIIWKLTPKKSVKRKKGHQGINKQTTDDLLFLFITFFALY